MGKSIAGWAAQHLTHRTVRAGSYAVLCFQLVACSTPGAMVDPNLSPGATGKTYAVVNIQEAGDILDLESTIPKIAELRTDGKSVTVKVGDGFRMRSIKVMAYDANGKLLGRLKQLDHDVQPRNVLGFATQDIIEAKSPGVGYLQAWAPLWSKLGQGRPKPTIRVEVLVTE